MKEPTNESFRVQNALHHDAVIDAPGIGPFCNQQIPYQNGVPFPVPH